MESDNARPALRVSYTADSLFKQKQFVLSNKGNKVLLLPVPRNTELHRYDIRATFSGGDTLSDCSMHSLNKKLLRIFGKITSKLKTT